MLSERQNSYRLPRVLQRTVVRGMQEIETRVLTGAARIALLSEFTRNELAALDAQTAAQAELIPGGLDVHKFSPGPTRPSRRLGGGRDGPAVHGQTHGSSHGDRRARPGDDADRARPPGTRLAIAGSGALRPEIEREIRERGLQDSVRLLGRVSDEDLVRWYRSASLVVMPTQELEGFGLTTAEALACQTPVVGTPAGATPEILSLVDPRLITRDTTPEALAEGIADMLRDPEALRRAGEIGRRLTVDTMSWESVAARYLELYRTLPAPG